MRNQIIINQKLKSATLHLDFRIPDESSVNHEVIDFQQSRKQVPNVAIMRDVRIMKPASETEI
jgi:hypothetical protein